ncbi:MAG: hypothetical protein ACOY3X_07150 [Pseudomonadota bacterium]
MLRILLGMALIFGALWFYLKAGSESQVAGEQQKKMIDSAQEAVQATEEAAALMARQADAARDAAGEAAGR